MQASRARATLLLPSLLTIAGIGLTALGTALFTAGVMRLQVFPSDFSQDYFAALALRHGRSIYSDLSAISEFNNQPIQLRGILNYHPPFNAILFLPLTAFAYRTATIAWSALTLILYGLTGWIILHELGLRYAWPTGWLIVGLALCWDPFIAQVAHGQLSIVLVSCIISAWASLRHGHQTLAGLLLGLACLIKLFPGLLIAYLALRRQWIATRAAVLCVALGYGFTLVVVGVEDVVHYHQEVMRANAALYGPYPLNVSLSGVFYRLFTDNPWSEPIVNHSQLALFSVALTSLILLTPLLYQRSHDSRADDESFALTCIGMLLISPITWGHIFPILWLPLGLIARRWQITKERAIPTPGLLSVILISLPNLSIARALISHYAPYRMPWATSLLLLGPTLGILLLWGMLVWQRSHVAAIPSCAEPHR